MLIYVPTLPYYRILILFIKEKPISDPPEGSQKKKKKDGGNVTKKL